MCNRHFVPIAIFAVLAMGMMPTVGHATARLISVTPVSGGCVSGPTGGTVQHWDVERGETYTVTISHVAECASGGDDPPTPGRKSSGTTETIHVRVNSSGSGNFDLIATMVAPGIYEFDFTVPKDATCTMPIFYCTTPGDGSSGIFVIRDDGQLWQAHLRAATFDAGCTNPTEIPGPFCDSVPTEPSTWGRVKALFE